MYSQIRNIALIFFLSLFSCQNNDDIIFNVDNLLTGNWVNPHYDDTTREVTFTKANQLIDNDYGMSFKTNAEFIERTSGFCGTPPLSFDDWKGVWIKQTTIITISSDYYSDDYQLEIVSLTKDTLIIKRL